MSRLLIWLALLPFLCHGQTLYSDLNYRDSTITLAPDITIGTVAQGYVAITPETPRGAIIFFQAAGPIDTQSLLMKKALDHNLAIINISTSNKFEFLFSTDKRDQLSGFLKHATDSLEIPRDNLHFAGMSLAGTRALIMGLYLAEKNPELKPRSIVMCDTPLDFIRFYKEGIKAKEGQYQEAAANEGYWTSTYLANNLDGTPESNRGAYLTYSPMSYFHEDTDHLNPLHDVAIRCYTEPNVKWWMATRKKDYYGMNSLDMALLINELNIKGHPSSELILTEDKGYRKDGTYHPHSWSIVNETEMVEWMISLD